LDVEQVDDIRIVRMPVTKGGFCRVEIKIIEGAINGE
jgi:hypothetical protein